MTTTQPKLRLIQCGAGGFGDHWLKGITLASPDFELVALVDIDAANLDLASANHNIPRHRLFTSIEDALDQVTADAVLSVTPPAVHASHARIAFDRGLHFMTEKPIADTLEHAQQMVARARAAGRQFVVSQNYRFRAPIHALTRALANNTVGALGHGHMDFYIPADFTGTFRETMEDVLIMDMAVHHFDLIRYVTGLNVARVHAHSFRPEWSWYRHNSAAKVLLELERNIPFTYSGDWSGHGRCSSWDGIWRLQCADGSLHLDGDQQVRAARCGRWNENPSEEVVPSIPIPLTGQAATLHSFAQAIRTGIPSSISGEDNLQTFAAVCAAVISSRERRTVDIAELLR
jgi:predicted dehydrogenase